MPRGTPSALWVSALVRRAELGGAFATVARRGDAERGEVLVKVVTARGRARLYVPAFTMDGPSAFELATPGEDPEEAEADALIQRRVRADADLWVVEIEDRAGRHFLTEAVR